MASKDVTGTDAYVLEPVTLEDESDGDYDYEEVPEAAFDEDEDAAGFDDYDGENDHQVDEDFETALQSLKKYSIRSQATGGHVQAEGTSGLPEGTLHLDTQKAGGTRSERERERERDGKTEMRGEVVEDFIRNFLNKHNLHKTLQVFESEWYEALQTHKVSSLSLSAVPDVYLQNQSLEEEVRRLRGELGEKAEIATKAQSTWDKFRKERDYHRMHHRRVVQEKNKLVEDLKRLRKHYAHYEPMFHELKRKYELAMKQKMLSRIERDKMAAKAEAMEQTVQGMEVQLKRVEGLETPGVEGREAALTPASGGRRGRSGKNDTSTSTRKGTQNTSAKSTSLQKSTRSGTQKSLRREGEREREREREREKGARLPTMDYRNNPYLSMEIDRSHVESWQMAGQAGSGQVAPVSHVSWHPTKPVLAVAADDATWKLFAAPSGELIMTGEGHTDWLSCCEFSKDGACVATTAGDGAMKIWGLSSARCELTLADHTQAVWSVDWHQDGDFAVTASMDHTCKLWDLTVGRCRQTFRGHVDSVNSARFQPYSSYFCTSSGDKTVSLWDLRSGLCVQTFYGHRNACNYATFNNRGDIIASSDVDGVISLWDVRMVAELTSVQAGPAGINKLSFDPSSEVLIAPCDDQNIKLFHVQTQMPNKSYGAEQPEEGLEVAISSLGEKSGHRDSVLAAAVHSNGKIMASGAADGSVIMWS